MEIYGEMRHAGEQGCGKLEGRRQNQGGTCQTIVVMTGTNHIDTQSNWNKATLDQAENMEQYKQDTSQDFFQTDDIFG